MPMPAESRTDVEGAGAFVVDLDAAQQLTNSSGTTASEKIKQQGREEHCIEYSSVCVDVNGKRILHNVSGCARSGQLLAVMGETGSGKSTFLNCLGNRSPYRGQVAYDGLRWTKATRRRVGFVEQDDQLFSQLTVRETLRYQGQFKLSNTMTPEEIEARVDSVIAELHLGKCADTRVGSALQRGISGGERKRLSIGLELITTPDFIILDEPTSGLDSRTALSLIETLGELSANGHVIVLSIHQPSSQSFAQFSQLLLLSDGYCVFQGNPQAVGAFFTDHGMPPCPPGWNLADYVLDSVMSPSFKERWQRPESSDPPSSMTNEALEGAKDVAQDRYGAPQFKQAALLTHRCLKLYSGTAFSTTNLLLFVGTATLIGMLWFGFGGAEADIFPRAGMALWLVGTWSFFPLFGALPVFHADRPILSRELRSGTFKLSSYFVARTFVLMLLQLPWMVAYVTIVWWLSRPSLSVEPYLKVLALELLCIYAMEALGLLISAAFSAARTFVVGVLVMTFCFSWSGFFLPVDQVQPWLRWLPYINPLAYLNQLSLRVVFSGDREFACAAASEFEICDTADTIGRDEVLEEFGARIPAWVCVVVLLSGSFVFRYLAYRFLRHNMALS